MCLAVRFVLMLLWHVFLYVQLLVLGALVFAGEIMPVHRCRPELPGLCTSCYLISELKLNWCRADERDFFFFFCPLRYLSTL